MKRRESILLLLLLLLDSETVNISCAIYIHIEVALSVLGGHVLRLELLEAGFAGQAHAFLEDGGLFGGEVWREVGDAEAGGGVSWGGSVYELGGRAGLLWWAGGDGWRGLVGCRGQGVLG